MARFSREYIPTNLFTNLALRKRAEIPIYSFAKHAREEATTSIYSPHVLILEGIFALYDPRVLELLDMKVRERLAQTSWKILVVQVLRET
jgi:uridine kinase